MLIRLNHDKIDNSISITITTGNHMARWVSENHSDSYLSDTVNILGLKPLESFISEFEKNGNNYNERGGNTFSPFKDCITIQSPQHLKALFTKIKEQAQIDQTGKVTIDSDKFNSIKESTISSNDFKLRFKESTSPKTPKQQFLDEHEKLFVKSKKGIFEKFRNTNLDKDMNLSQILQYAKDNNNRSRKACIKLGWMKIDGTLNEQNPNLPSEVRDAYPKSDTISSFKKR